MPKLARLYVNKVAVLALIALGVVLLVVSIYSSSSLLAVFWVALTFFGAILVYSKPSKRVPFDVLYDETDVSVCNIERILNWFSLSSKGIYLPPANLSNPDSSLVFVPKGSDFTLPSVDEVADNFETGRKDGVLIVPPGLVLCRLFERELKVSFSSFDLRQLKVELPMLLVETLELAKGFEMSVNGNVVIVDIRESAFDRESLNRTILPRTRECVGSPLCSAIACVLAKCARVPVRVGDETRVEESKTLRATFELMTSGSSSIVEESLKTQLVNDFSKIALPKISQNALSFPSLNTLKPVVSYLVGLLALVLVVDVSVWFAGWSLYGPLGVWQFLPNLDFKNLLLLSMELLSVLILFAGRFLRKLADVEAFGWFSLVGVIVGLDAAAWTGGWLLFGRFQLSFNNTVYEGLILAAMALISIVVFLWGKKPKSLIG